MTCQAQVQGRLSACMQPTCCMRSHIQDILPKDSTHPQLSGSRRASLMLVCHVQSCAVQPALVQVSVRIKTS